MIVYGTKDCPNCVSSKAELDELGIPYEFLDLAETKNLKEFLKMRDSLKLYEPVKEQGSIGIPTFILDDNSISISFDEVKEFYGA